MSTSEVVQTVGVLESGFEVSGKGAGKHCELELSISCCGFRSHGRTFFVAGLVCTDRVGSAGIGIGRGALTGSFSRGVNSIMVVVVAAERISGSVVSQVGVCSLTLDMSPATRLSLVLS